VCVCVCESVCVCVNNKTRCLNHSPTLDDTFFFLFLDLFDLLKLAFGTLLFSNLLLLFTPHAGNVILLDAFHICRKACLHLLHLFSSGSVDGWLDHLGIIAAL